MKQTLTFTPSVIPSTASRLDPDAFDRSLEAFNEKRYRDSFLTLLDFIGKGLRTRYGNADATAFEIPHGSIVVRIRTDGGRLRIEAPFLELPGKGRIPLLRQAAVLNICGMDLPRIVLRGERLYFEYECPMTLVHPAKIYYVLRDICHTGDRYDDEFVTKFHARRICEPRIERYDAEMVARLCGAIRAACDEGLREAAAFQNERNYGYAWNIIATTLLRICYLARPQGQLLNQLDRAIHELDREDIPLPEVVSRGCSFARTLGAMSDEELAEGLYRIETFIPEKSRATLKSIQDAFSESAARCAEALERKDYAVCCLSTVYKFYEMYYNSDVPEQVDAVISQALAQSASRPLEEAAPLLNDAMECIMEGDFGEEEDGGGDDPSAKATAGETAPSGEASASEAPDTEAGAAEPTPLQREAMTGVLLQSGFLERYMKQRIHGTEAPDAAGAAERPDPKQTER